jgi:RNA polymerase sigma-70 factor, ECF subfamily
MGDPKQIEAMQVAAALVARIGRGDRVAETELIRRYSRAVTFILSRRCADSERVRDVHQETFITVIESLRRSGVNTPEALSAFIQATAVNLLIAEGRRDARRKTDTDIDALMARADTSPGPPEKVDQANEARLVREVIAELPVPRDRLILHRYYIEDRDKDEICQELGISHLHFHRVLFRARQRFLDGLSRARSRPDAPPVAATARM